MGDGWHTGVTQLWVAAGWLTSLRTLKGVGIKDPVRCANADAMVHVFACGMMCAASTCVWLASRWGPC
jgi:hypothetical protein